MWKNAAAVRVDSKMHTSIDRQLTQVHPSGHDPWPLELRRCCGQLDAHFDRPAAHISIAPHPSVRCQRPVHTFITQVSHLINTSRLRSDGLIDIAGALLATMHAGKQVSRAHSLAAAGHQWQRLP